MDTRLRFLSFVFWLAIVFWSNRSRKLSISACLHKIIQARTKPRSKRLDLNKQSALFNGCMIVFTHVVQYVCMYVCMYACMVTSRNKSSRPMYNGAIRAIKIYKNALRRYKPFEKGIELLLLPHFTSQIRQIDSLGQSSKNAFF